jgi:hypothetical protein
MSRCGLHRWRTECSPATWFTVALAPGGARVNRDDFARGNLDANAPPWDYNPSAYSQRIPIAILAALGFAISVYLAL